MVMTVSCDWQKLHEITRNLLEKYVLDFMYSPFIKISYITDLPPCFFRAVSQSCLRCRHLLAVVLILPRIKLNSRLPHCALFKDDRVFRCFSFLYFIQRATQIFLSCSGFFLHDWLNVNHWSYFCEYWNNSFPLK